MKLRSGARYRSKKVLDVVSWICNCNDVSQTNCPLHSKLHNPSKDERPSLTRLILHFILLVKQCVCDGLENFHRRLQTDHRSQPSALPSNSSSCECAVGATAKSRHINVMEFLSWLLFIGKMLVPAVIVIYGITPLLLWSVPSILTRAVFLNIVAWPPFVDLTQPEALGLPVTRNFYLQSEENVTLGLWHVLPHSLASTAPAKDVVSEEFFEKCLGDGRPIVLYLHGNAGSRGGWHRVQLYKVFSQLDFHLVTLDYRGFGDSIGEPSEDGLCHDAAFVYHWVKERSNGAKVIIWGHSLGSGVTTRIASHICNTDKMPRGVVLESPFTNIQEAAHYHPISLLFRAMPGFSRIFVEPLAEHKIFFSNDDRIADVTCPLMILHAEDDGVVPYTLGEKLHKIALKSRPKHVAPAKFVTFDGCHGYGHKHIHSAPNLPTVIREFIEQTE